MAVRPRSPATRCGEVTGHELTPSQRACGRCCSRSGCPRHESRYDDYERDITCWSCGGEGVRLGTQELALTLLAHVPRLLHGRLGLPLSLGAAEVAGCSDTAVIDAPVCRARLPCRSRPSVLASVRARLRPCSPSSAGCGSVQLACSLRSRLPCCSARCCTCTLLLGDLQTDAELRRWQVSLRLNSMKLDFCSFALTRRSAACCRSV